MFVETNNKGKETNVSLFFLTHLKMSDTHLESYPQTYVTYLTEPALFQAPIISHTSLHTIIPNEKI